EWYEGDGAALSKLLKELNRRRTLVRTLIRNSCQRMPLIFPKWLSREPTPVRYHLKYHNHARTRPKMAGGTLDFPDFSA
ncbi:MAG: hypothetical protein WCE61_07125, partial [Candidatus Acidiferrum sp.]